MRIGKLPPDLLAHLLDQLPRSDPHVRVPPRPGEDAAAIDVDHGTLIVTTDPVTFVSDRAAWYAVHVNANDVAAMGGEPTWLATTVLLPPACSEADVEALFAQLATACSEVDVTLVTGHTEVTDAVVRPVVIGTMIGLAGEHGVVTSAGARPGDAVLLAGSIAVEGTAALAVEASDDLLKAGLDAGALTAAAGVITSPGISVVRASRVIRGATRPHALHDATEGGIATALREVAVASGVGLDLEAASLPLLPITRRLCDALGIDPLGLISSGCLVAVVESGDAERTVVALTAAGITARQVGIVTKGADLVLRTGRGSVALPSFDRDELARFFEERGPVA